MINRKTRQVNAFWRLLDQRYSLRLATKETLVCKPASATLPHSHCHAPAHRPAAASGDATAGCDKLWSDLGPFPDCCRWNRTANALDA